MAQSSLAHGELGLLKDKTLNRIAERLTSDILNTSQMSDGTSTGLGKISPAAVSLAWLHACGITPVVAASTRAHMDDALMSISLASELTEEDLKSIGELNRERHVGKDPREIA